MPRDSEESDAPPSSDGAADSQPTGARADEQAVEEGSSRGTMVLRYLFYAVWLLIVPLAGALAAVWALTPTPASYPADWFRSFVGEQQVPAMILFFTLIAMVLWRFRYALPLAGLSGVLARQDLPPRLRARFDDAAQLLDEARRIMRLRRRDVERALRPSERNRIRDALDDLAEAMAATPLDEPRLGDTLGRADKLVTEYLSRWRKSELREYAESIGVAVAVALVLRVFVIEAFKIPSGSMVPTLMIGDHIFVAKYAYGPLLPFSEARLYERLPPARGDVMVFRFPEKPEQDFIKRVVAIPGDKLEALDGRVVLNGWLTPNCYVGRLDAGSGLDGELYMEYLGDRAYLTLFKVKPSGDPCQSEGDCGPQRSCRGGVCGELEGPFYVAPNEAWVMGDNRNNSHDSRSWRNDMGAGVPFENIKGRAMFVWLSWNQEGGIAYDRLFVSVMGKPHLPAGTPPAVIEGLERCLRERPALSQTTPPERAP